MFKKSIILFIVGLAIATVSCNKGDKNSGASADVQGGGGPQAPAPAPKQNANASSDCSGGGFAGLSTREVAKRAYHLKADCNFAQEQVEAMIDQI